MDYNVSPTAGMAGAFGRVMQERRQRKNLATLLAQKAKQEKEVEGYKGKQQRFTKLYESILEGKAKEKEFTAERELEGIKQRGETSRTLQKTVLENEGKRKLAEYTLQNDPRIKAGTERDRALNAEATARKLLADSQRLLNEFKLKQQQTGVPDKEALQQIYGNLDGIDRQTEALMALSPEILEQIGLDHKRLAERLQKVQKQKGAILQQMGGGMVEPGLTEFPEAPTEQREQSPGYFLNLWRAANPFDNPPETDLGKEIEDIINQGKK